ncbi:G5 and 3D domain-containing protein [Paenisporosarcina indica]|uniref:G5 and 3D domain-containing protein n=1 Tax=Paenisporosarcina indica TaxID=650093 RepID=UPI00094FC044|nr:G5 and 3D domain-containing protein [Paenisporosarcina indica]
MSKILMKKLFTNTLRSKQAGLVLIGIILFVSVISAVLFVGTKNTVAFTVNGKQQDIRTHADTVGDLLNEHNIQVSKADLVSPSVNTLIEDGISIEWEQAKKITITVDGKEQTIQTTADQVSQVLTEANIEVSEHDKLTPELDAKVGPNENIAIEKAFPVTLVDGVNEKKIWSTSTTVADFLKQQEIQMNEFDRVEQRMEDLVIPNDVIQVVRVEKVTDVVEAATNFAVETRIDKNILKGKEKVVQEGKEGLTKRTYEIVSENGKQVSRVLKSEDVVKEPLKKVVAVGTKVVTASVSRGSTTEAPSGGKEFYVSATAYTAYCNGCSGITATGIDLRSNPSLKVIAVDPEVIPLGSKVWVEGYGYAVAGDTGGAIKGMKIDLFMPTTDQAFGFGRKKVKIKILD